MHLIKIGNDFFNLDYLISVNVKKHQVVLKFTENVSVTIKNENWEELVPTLEIKTEIGNDYKPVAISI